eukprot:2573784-Pyramimonas_sp.AAC.1
MLPSWNTGSALPLKGRVLCDGGIYWEALIPVECPAEPANFTPGDDFFSFRCKYTSMSTS